MAIKSPERHTRRTNPKTTQEWSQIGPDEVFDRAVPHEAGHALVAYKLEIPVQQIAICMNSAQAGGYIAALIQFPTEEEVPQLPQQRKLAYCIVLGGGIAGELFESGVVNPLNQDASTGDNLLLRRFTEKSLTDFEPEASLIINNNRRKFRQLCSMMRANYPSVRDQIDASSTGAYTVVSDARLKDLLANME